MRRSQAAGAQGAESIGASVAGSNCAEGGARENVAAAISGGGAMRECERGDTRRGRCAWDRGFPW